MSWLIFSKLLNIFLVGAIGWFVGRMRWLGHADASGGDPARVLSRAAFYIFVPALMFRTTSRVDFAGLPWAMLYAFFGPLLLLILGAYTLQRWRGKGRIDVAVPSVRAITASFGNTVQVGIPLAASLFGEAGLAVHVTVMSLHALTILTLLTALIVYVAALLIRQRAVRVFPRQPLQVPHRIVRSSQPIDQRGSAQLDQGEHRIGDGDFIQRAQGQLRAFFICLDVRHQQPGGCEVRPEVQRQSEHDLRKVVCILRPQQCGEGEIGLGDPV